MVKLKCMWCLKDFEQTITKKDGERTIVICPYCNRNNPSSIKEPTENDNRKHIHREYK